MRHFRFPATDTAIAFDRWAPTYDEDEHALLAATDWILQRVSLTCADSEVLEIGCGSGRIAARALGEGARHYTGVDASEGMLARARWRCPSPRATFLRGDVDQELALPGTYDLVVVVLALEYVTDLERFCASLGNVTRPGGRLRILGLHPERVAEGVGSHFLDRGDTYSMVTVNHPVASLIDGLARHGFDVVRRDWMASHSMVQAVPGLAAFESRKLFVDLAGTRRRTA